MVSEVHQAVKDFNKDYKGEGYKQTDTYTLVVGIADSVYDFYNKL